MCKPIDTHVYHISVSVCQQSVTYMFRFCIYYHLPWEDFWTYVGMMKGFSKHAEENLQNPWNQLNSETIRNYHLVIKTSSYSGFSMGHIK